ncbi:MAG: hypothetical protein AAF467_17640 [Actinomycetota bacterium]
MLVAVSSIKGAPGVSCWALMLAAAWSHSSDRVLVEADGSGGVVSARYGAPAEPGTGDLLSAARSGQMVAPDLSTVSQQLRPAVDEEPALWMVPAPLLAHQATKQWAALAGPGAAAMAADRRLWVADCGRVWPGAPTEHLLVAAQVNVVVSDSSVESLVLVQSRVASLPGSTAVLVVGNPTYGDDEIAQFTNADLVCSVPYVNNLSALVVGFTKPKRQGHRSKAWREALRIADELAGLAAMSSSVAGTQQPPSTPPPQAHPPPLALPYPPPKVAQPQSQAAEPQPAEPDEASPQVAPPPVAQRPQTQPPTPEAQAFPQQPPHLAPQPQHNPNINGAVRITYNGDVDAPIEPAP